MRVIAGAFKGRRLLAPRWAGVRPTSDKVRETLFNVLAPEVRDARVLDAYAGTGALGIEALSRGAKTATFIERDPRVRDLIAQNLAHCGILEGCAIIRASVTRGLDALSRAPAFVPFDIVLLDPPYELAAADALTGIEAVTRPGGLVVLEHARRRPSPDLAGRLVRTRELPSGSTALTFYRCRP
jgi:16S rRNA (guanine966-N2)-methyltransferase